MSPATVIRFAIYLFAGLLLFGSTGLVLGFFLSVREATQSVAIRLPAERVAAERVYVPVEGELTLGTGIPSQVAGTWSQFRGDNRDAISTETIPLRRDWTTESPPPTLWGMPLGEGYAGFAVRNGRVYILDYDEVNHRDALRCLSLDDGAEIWRFSYPVRIKKNHGMSRTIPAVTDQYCVSLGPKCHVLCVDAITGEEKWLIDLQYQYGTTEPEWYAGQCPIITILPGSDKPSTIIAPASPEVLMVALDCETGEEIWRTPNPFDWTMTHSSLMPMTLDGQATFVYFAGDGIAGVRATDGEILWSAAFDWRPGMASCPSPVILSENRIFCSGGYNVGSTMLQIVPHSQLEQSQAGKYQAQILFRLPHGIFDSEQQTPIYYNGHIFGLRQQDKRFLCLDLNGRIVWESGRTERFGSGPYIVADGMILIVDDDGVLHGLEATSAAYRKLFEVEIMEDYACWAPMAIVQGRLLLRDQISMKCIDLRQ
jgi:outer membrane protein assembly factor BamB